MYTFAFLGFYYSLSFVRRYIHLFLYRSIIFTSLFLDTFCFNNAVPSTGACGARFLSRTSSKCALSTGSSFCSIGVSINMQTCLCPRSTSQNFQNRFPCSGFVKKIVSICSVGQCIIFLLFPLVTSCIQKQRIFMFWDLGPADELPLIYNFMALSLSCYIPGLP
jgi:hypothetical protein